MKIGLTEKQYERILSQVSENQEIKEDGETPAAEPEAGTSTQQSGGQGYPEVGKWESGVTRGPANQIGITKWSDVVGSTLKRDKANQLKEQTVVGAANNGTPVATVFSNNPKPEGYVDPQYSLIDGTPFKLYKTHYGEEIKIPSGGNFEVKLWDKDVDRLKAFSQNNNYDNDGKWYVKYTNGKTSETKKPSKQYMEMILPDETIRSIYSINDKRRFTIYLERKGEIWDTKIGYFDQNGKAYHSEEYITRGIKQWWKDNWELILTIVASAVAGIITGSASIWVQASAQAIAGVGAATFAYLITDPKDRDNIGYGINIILSFIPYMSAGLKIGIKAPLAGLPKISKYLNSAKTMEEVEAAIALLSKEEQILATRIIKQVPAEFNREFKTKMMEGFVKGVNNGSIKLAVIPFAERMWWKQMAAETGVQFIFGTAMNLPQVRTWLMDTYVNITKSKEELEKIKNLNEKQKKDVENYKIILNKIEWVQSKTKSITDEIYQEKFDPVLVQFENLRMDESNYENMLKYLNIYETMLDEYLKNKNVDLQTIIWQKYGK